MKQDLISVIVPVYNTEKYLRKCIKSILNQSYQNLELILVNDGSTDNSGNICDEFHLGDGRIKVVHKKNAGLSDARNTGLDMAMGDYVCFVDSDDYIHPEMLERLFLYGTKYKADIAMCDYYTVRGDQFPEPFYETVTVRELDSIQALQRLFGPSMAQAVVAWNKLYRKDMLSDIRFPVGKIHEDAFTTYQLYYKADKIIHTNEKLYYYVKRDDSITGSGFSKKNLDALDMHLERTEYFRKHGLTDLYKLSAHRYMVRMIKAYWKSVSSHEIDDETVKNLLLRFRKEFKRLRYMKGLNLGQRLNFYLFYLNPLIFKLSIKARRLIYRVIR